MKSTVIRVAFGALLSLPLFLALPAGAGAQVGLSLYGRSGLLAPDTYFYEVYENFLEGQTRWTTASLGRSFAAGGGLELRLGESGILIRAEAMRSFDSWMRLSHSRVIPRVFFEPPEIVTAWYDVPFTMTLTSVELVFPTKLRIWGAQPYVAVGGGGKFYQFGDPTLPADSTVVLPQDGFTWGGDAGAGLMVPLFWGLSADLQARTALSKYWDRTQTDFLYTGALHLKLW